MKIKKIAFYFITTICLTSCSIKLKSEMFFNKPETKIRLLEAENFEKTKLNYLVEKIKVDDSIYIETWTIENQNPENIFFLFSPSENSIANSCEIMEKIALSTNSKVIGIQYRGYNYSDGKCNLETSYKDNQIIFEHFKSTLKNYKTVNLIGMSIGTVFAPKIVRNNESIIDNIILLSTFSSPETMLKEIKRINIPWIVRPLIRLKPDENIKNINSIIELENYKNGILVFHAKDDEATGYKMAKELIEKSKCQKKELVLFEDGGHFAPYSEKYLDIVVIKINDFLKNKN